MGEAISGGRGGSGLGKVLGMVVLVLLALLLLSALLRGMAIDLPQNQAQASATVGMQCSTATSARVAVFIVKLSRAKYPESTAHIDEARTLYRRPYVLTLDRPGTEKRREEATKNFPRVSGKEPDEYPPAIAKEGGVNAHVKNIDASDNHRSGASMGNQLRSQRDGNLFCIELTP